MYHGYKPWELLGPAPQVHELLDTWDMESKTCCTCNSAMAWWTQLKTASRRREIPSSCVNLHDTYDAVLKSYMGSSYEEFTSKAPTCVENAR